MALIFGRARTSISTPRSFRVDSPELRRVRALNSISEERFVIYMGELAKLSLESVKAFIEE
ncbi:hypothetical protein [Haladaptatus sp. DYF46]|uniref:hypothetical protein n=1 Tax=Haladaptatus sp. DYF46 TaxID=2886041 RepID=UPI001E367F54|nr:hypothetical protein [Haladaptatus sp. DYF46]